jgi:hypothetical protein
MRGRLRRYGTVAFWLGAILAVIWGLSWGLGTVQWGPFRGQIVDVETGQPIEGTAVLVVWWKDIPTPVHGVEKFYDAREAVTDAEGRFEVPWRLPALFWLFIRRPQLSYFAPAYVAHDVVVTPPDGRPFVDPTVVQMRRLKTKEELLKKSRGQPAGVPKGKMMEFQKAIRVERKMLGLDPIPFEPARGKQQGAGGGRP